MGPEAMILVFLMLSFKPAFFTLLFYPPRGSLVPLHFLPLECYHLHIWGCWYFSWQSWFQLVIHPAWHFVWCTLYTRYAEDDTQMIYMCVFGGELCWIFVAVWAFLYFWWVGVLSSCGTWASHCYGFCCCGAWALRCAGFSSCGALPLEHRLSCCRALASLLCRHLGTSQTSDGTLSLLHWQVDSLPRINQGSPVFKGYF